MRICTCINEKESESEKEHEGTKERDWQEKDVMPSSSAGIKVHRNERGNRVTYEISN